MTSAPPKLYVTLDSSGKDTSFCQVRLFLSIGSCLIITKIWKDRLITAQADRISQLLAHGSKYLKQRTTYSSVIAQGDRTFIKQTVDSTLQRCRGKPTLKGRPWSLSAYLFILPIASSWFCPVQNRAYTHHQSRKGMEMGICSRPIDSCKLHNNRLCCACLTIIQSVIIRCIYV